METRTYNEWIGTSDNGTLEVRLVADNAEYPPCDYFLYSMRNTLENTGETVEMTGSILDDCYLRE